MKTIKTLATLAALMISAAGLGAATIESGSANLKNGKKLTLGENYVRYDTELKADFKFSSFSSLEVGRGGEDVYRGAWIEVTPVYVIVHECAMITIKDKNTKKKKNVMNNHIREAYRHDLDIKETLSISIHGEFGKYGYLTVKTGSGEWKKTLQWFGGGAAFARVNGPEAAEVELSFNRLGADRDFWFYCDSYGSFGTPRWPWFAKAEGKDSRMMIDNLPGGRSETMLLAFIEDLKYGTPKYAVWMLGMNDRNDTEVADESWALNVEDFVRICKKKGITPIVTAIPCVPKRKHQQKIAYAKSLGCRILDWNAAVEATPDGVWAEKCLSGDKVHPTEKGAERLWKQIKKDIPEL